MCHGPKAADSRNQDLKTNENLTIKVKISRQRGLYMNVLVRNNTSAGPWAGRSKPRAGPSNCWAGPCRARVLWASLPRDRPGRADTFEKMMGRAAADPLKFDGPGHQRRHMTSLDKLQLRQKHIWSMMYIHDVLCGLWSFVGWYGTQ